MKIAENITIDAKGLLIDGRRLPYYLGIKPMEVEIGEIPGLPAMLTVTLMADSISIGTGIEATPDGDVILLEEDL